MKNISKEEFISLYMDDYIRMAYRKLTKNVNINDELKLIHIVYDLLDRFVEGELSDYVHYNKIV